MYTTGAYYSGNQFPANLYGSPTNTFNMADGMLNHLKNLEASTPSGLPMSYSSGSNQYGYNSGSYGYGYGNFGYNPAVATGLFGFGLIANAIGSIGAAKVQNATFAQGQIFRNSAMQQQMAYTQSLQSQQSMMESLKMLLVLKSMGIMGNQESKA